MKSILLLISVVLLCSCINERDMNIRVANTMIGYYQSMIAYEDSVDNMPIDYRLSLRDSLEHWYNVRHELIAND